MKLYNHDSFSFFYVPKVDFRSINLSKDTKIYVPINDACWTIKTPCAGDSEDLKVKKMLGYEVFLSKN